MPLFEFGCEQCTATFEELVPSEKAAGAVTCPQCGSASVRKRISTFASRMGQSARRAESAPSPCATGSCCLNGNCGR